MLDADVLQHFKDEASRPGAEPYQTQINRALRAYVFEDEQAEDRLARDPQFIDRVAERVANYVYRRGTGGSRRRSSR